MHSIEQIKNIDGKEHHIVHYTEYIPVMYDDDYENTGFYFNDTWYNLGDFVMFNSMWRPYKPEWADGYDASLEDTFFSSTLVRLVTADEIENWDYDQYVLIARIYS